MENRINISQAEPKAYQAMFGLEKYLGGADLSPALKELIKVRASQLNSCAYCIEMHTAEAKKQGETEQRLYALSAWSESPLFSDQERAVLALTEEVTFIAEGGLATETYEAALAALGENQLAQAIMQIATINAWNRMAVATKMRHE